MNSRLLTARHPASIGEPATKTYPDLPRVLTRANVRKAIGKYTTDISHLSLGKTGRLRGRELLQALKRKEVGRQPYPGVSWFEAANRVMSDLVLLYGVRWLLNHRRDYPFGSYKVQYGNEQTQRFDIVADSSIGRLAGEVFNASESFFPLKMRATLDKLHALPATTYKVVAFNAEMSGKCKLERIKDVTLIAVDATTGRSGCIRGTVGRKP